jgi:hypothetical protein
MRRTFEANAENFVRYSSVMSNAHYDMAEIYRKRHRCFGLAVVIATSVVGTAAFGSLAKVDMPPEREIWERVGVGILSVLSTVLAALQTFLGFSDLQTQHKHGADGYSEVRRDIDLLLMKYPDATGAPSEDATAALDAIKKKLDDLDKASPTIPDTVYKAASAKTPEPE